MEMIKTLNNKNIYMHIIVVLKFFPILNKTTFEIC